MINIIKEVSSNGYKMITFSVEDCDQMIAINYPTSNCQVFSIAPLSSILSSYINKEDALNIVKGVRDALGTGSPLMLFDVQAKYESRLKEIFEIHSITPYVSSNSSKMLLGLIKIGY